MFEDKNNVGARPTPDMAGNEAIPFEENGGVGDDLQGAFASGEFEGDGVDFQGEIARGNFVEGGMEDVVSS